ncbi:RNase A-like domain-containing protein, partial [Streptomyces chrestomyceticus]|uniref:RNase A-like domain-containing protein n=1 Tax=Streptomyces chrestomyceticus TaxID=68185 RepID=UPI00379F4077
GARAVRDAGGFKTVFGRTKLDGLGNFDMTLPNLGAPRPAMAGDLPVGPGSRALMREGDFNAWPRNKRRGAVNPKPHRSNLKGDEGKNGSHTLERHVEKTTKDMRDRLRGDTGIKADSRFLDEGSAQRLVDETLARHRLQIDDWLRSSRQKMPPITAHFDSPTGLSLSRESYIRGQPAEWVKGVKVILKRDAEAPDGFRVLTSYPCP